MLRTDLTLDWWWLYLQVVILLAICTKELFRPRGRNLYAILISATMLLLVQGQAWWMLDQFEENSMDHIQHLFQSVSLHGARLANVYTGLTVLCFGLTYAILTVRQYPVIARVSVQMRYGANSGMSYVLVTIWTVVAGALLLGSAGGLEAALTKPGQNLSSGVAMWLMMSSLSKLPLLHGVASRQRIRWLDYILFGLTLFLFILNSRFLTTFIILQCALLRNYCWREVPRRVWVGIIFVLVIIVFVFGTYRDFTGQLDKLDRIDPEALQEFMVSRGNISVLVDWFYQTNVEGFSGLAGLLTYEEEQNGIAHDYGLSNLAVIPQFIPYGLRNDPSLPFGKSQETLRSLYPYNGSVVPSGLENAYAHFGLLGMLGLGVLLGYLAHWLHMQLLNPSADRLKIALVSVHSLELVRGSFYLALFYALSELIMLLVFRLILSVSKALTPRVPSQGTSGREVILT